MKPFIPYSLLAAAALCGVAFGQTATTTPVGYVTHTVNSQAGAESLTLLSPPLIQPSEFAGASSVSPAGTSTITFAGGVPVGLDTSYVLEIRTGADEGWWSTVISSTTDSITINDSFPAGSPAATSVSVRKHNTVQSFLGNNEPGLLPFDGVTGDEVQLLNPDQSLIAIAYVPAALTGLPEDNWFNLATSAPANDQIIEPGAAIIIKTVGSASEDFTFVSSGEVKITDTQVDLFPGLTLVGQPNAVGATFNQMGFQFSLIPLNDTASNTDFDELQILNPDQSLTAYAALDPALIGTATVGNLADSSDAGATLFAEGTGAIIKRDAANPASTITIPGSVVAP